jgi:hypothetical protein
MRSSLIPAFLCLLLASCGASRTLIPYTPSKAVKRSYALGQTATVAVGEPIFTVQNAALRPAYEASIDYQPPTYDFWNGGHPYPLIRKGTLFGVDGSSADGAVRVSSSEFSLAPLLSNPGSSEKEIVPIWIHADSGYVLEKPRMGGKEWSRDPIFTRSKEGVVEGGAFKAELIYSGLTGRTVKAVYREFVNDYARPAFTTDLQYNLDESSVIAYRTVKIEVVKATNSALEFRVLSDEDLKWLP